jgi:hypothetical protein
MILTTARRSTLRGATCFALLCAGASSSAYAQDDEQQFDLQPGWNSIFIEIQPEPAEPGAVFGGLQDLASVWTWVASDTPLQFIRDSRERPWKEPGWRAYFPPSCPEWVLTNLHAVLAHRAYLVRLDGTQAQTLIVRGRRVLRELRWQADGFSHVGLPVDPAAPPTFEAFFQPSPAHYDPLVGLHDVYRLSDLGAWELAAPADLVRRGEAYWVQTRGASTYQGPLALAVDLGGDALEFSSAVGQQVLSIRNAADEERTVTVAFAPGAPPLPVLYASTDADSAQRLWRPLPGAFAARGGGEITVRLAVRAADLPPGEDDLESTLTVSDGAGVKHVLAVRVLRATPSRVRAQGAGAGPAAPNFAGLWLGTARIRAVSDANPTVPDLSFDLQLTGLRPREPLVAAGERWRYEDSGVDLGVDWRQPGYDDTGWTESSAELGFNDGDEATLITRQQSPTYYFRKRFEVAGANRYTGLRVRLKRDDGAVVYLNGIELVRDNMPSLLVTFDRRALQRVLPTDESVFQEFDVASSALLDGENVLAVEVHQAPVDGYTGPPPDDDLSFDLELLGSLAATTEDLLVPGRDTWQYFSSGPAPAGWESAAQVPWPQGAAEFGFGDGDETTEFPPPERVHPAYFFRKRFSIPDPTQYSGLRLRLKRDDGAVVYLNGVELARSNMRGDGPIEFMSRPLAIVGGGDEDLFEVRDFRIVQVVAAPATEVAASSVRAGDNLLAVEVHQYAGELVEQAGSAPTPAPSEFESRLLVHVDDSGESRLLKEVILLKEATAPGDPNGVERLVLLTDDSLIPSYEGVTLRGGTPAGKRLSTSTFDFYSRNPDGTWVEARHLALTVQSGAGFGGGVLECRIVVPPNAATNPFRHKFHPDHDNLDAEFQPLPSVERVDPNDPGSQIDPDGSTAEVPRIVRDIEIEFLNDDPFIAGGNPVPPEQQAPGWGVTVTGGIYRETVTGLHKNPIHAEGFFRIQRVSEVSELDPPPRSNP